MFPGNSQLLDNVLDTFFYWADLTNHAFYCLNILGDFENASSGLKRLFKTVELELPPRPFLNISPIQLHITVVHVISCRLFWLQYRFFKVADVRQQIVSTLSFAKYAMFLYTQRPVIDANMGFMIFLFPLHSLIC